MRAGPPKPGRSARPLALSAKTQVAVPRCSACGIVFFFFLFVFTAWKPLETAPRVVVCVCVLLVFCTCVLVGREVRKAGIPSKLRVLLPQFKDVALQPSH